MAVRSIFARAPRTVTVPEREAPLMRVLEPRVLLDAAALETALDVAEQAVHSDLAELYLSPEAQSRPPGERTPFAVHRSAAFADLVVERLDADDIDDVIDQVVAAATHAEIVFIDARVPDVAGLLAGIDPAAEVHVLDAQSDGVAQMAAVLEGRTGIDALHLVSHGRAGALALGDATLDRAAMEGEQAANLAAIGRALAPNADLLVYGCDFGAGDAGRAAATLLARATGADVAVSDDLTGAGGDWDLEVRVGDVETRAFAVGAYAGTLNDTYAIAPTGQPTLGHVEDGVIGTLNTTARWSDAVTFDDGTGVQSYDLVAQFIGTSGDTSISFETAGDDVRIVVTNIGPVGPDGLLEPGAVTVQWRIVETGTNTPAPNRAFDIFFADIDGVGGVPDTGEGVSIDTANLSAYTLDANTNLTDFADAIDLGVFGTQPQTPTDQTGLVGLRWDSAREFRTTFHTRNGTTTFDMDGDGDHAFTNGVTVLAQEVDLDGADRSGATDGGFASVYRNHANITDAGAPVADATAVLRDLNDALLQTLTVSLTNPSTGDQLYHDAALANTLGLDVAFSSANGARTLTVTAADPDAEGVLTQHFESWLRTVTYRNDEPNGQFDRSYERNVSVTFADNLRASDPATTTISFVEVTTEPAHAPVSFAGQEGTPLSRNAAAGILADVVAPGGTATITAAWMADDIGATNPITPGQPFTTPAGARLTLGADGAFLYDPPAYLSGAEVVAFTITSGGETVESWVTFDIAPVADAPILTVTPADSSTGGSDMTSLEDEATDTLAVELTMPDPSQTLELLVVGVPAGAVLTDGTNTHLSDDPNQPVDVTDWALSTITVLPPENSDREITLTFIAYSEEVDLSFNEEVRDVTFTINAVADTPLLLIQPAGAAIDVDVNLGRAIDLSLIDDDGSEELVSLAITGVPPEVTFFVDGVERPADFPPNSATGTLILAPDEIANLVMSAPKDGQQHDYTFPTFATSREANPNGDVASATAVEGPVSMVISINALNDPVTANPDRVSAVSGAAVPIDLFRNDDIPDGGEQLVEIDGQTIDRNTPVTLAGGEGTVSIEANGVIYFTAAPTFSGIATFEYTVADDDFDIDTAIVVVDVQPRWNVETGPAVAEGDPAAITFVLDGTPAPGERMSVQPFLTADTADAFDVDNFDVAMNAAVAADTSGAFSWDGAILTYEAPQGPYVATHTPGANDYNDISDSALQLGADDDAIVRVDLGFDFPFFDNTFREAFVSANGYLTFGSPAGTGDNVATDGTALGGRPAIAAFWDDLSAAGPLDVYVEAASGPDGARTTIIQFELAHATGGGAGSFQMVLHEASGRIEMRYADVGFGPGADNGASATIGVQGGGFGTTFSLDTASIADGSSVIFDLPRTERPALAVALPTVDDADFEPQERMFARIANASGAALGEATADILIAVSDNTDPAATNDALATTKVQPITANLVLGTGGATADTDAEDHDLTLVAVEGTAFQPGDPIVLASGAVVRPEVDGSVLYDPNGAFDQLNVGETATDTFTYTVDDGFGGTATATVTVTIEGLNVPPTIDLNGGQSGVDTRVSYADTDPAVAVAPAMRLDDVDDTAFSRLEIALGGFVQGNDERLTIRGETFSHSQARTATVSIAGNAVEIAYDGANTITATAAGGGEMPTGVVTVLTRSITYENAAALDVGGERTLTFTVSDGDLTSDPAVATIDVAGSNYLPVAVDDGPFAGVEDTTQTIAAATLLANDSDPDGDAFDLVAVADGTGGTVSLDANGDVVFVPDADHDGAATFAYTIEDENGGQSTATVTLDLAGENDAPRLDLNGADAGTGHAAAYTENGSATPIVPAEAVLSDPDDTDLAYAYIQLANGQTGDRITVGALPPGITATITPDAARTAGLAGPGAVTVALTGTASRADYLVALQAIGFESASENPDTSDRRFDVAVHDGDALSAVVRTTMTVTAANDAPAPGDDGAPVPLAGEEDVTLRIPVAQLLANDVDPDGDVLTFVSVQDAVNGTVARDGADIVFTPDPDHAGPASFTYTVRDGANARGTATVSLLFAAANDAPAIDLAATLPNRGNSVDYVENGAPVAIAAADATITDIDSSDLAGLTVRLANGRAGDVLAADGLPAGISATLSPAAPLVADGPLTLTLMGTASQADYEAALRLVTFASVSDAPTEDRRNITVTVSDGAASSLAATAFVNVTETPDDPVAVDDGPLPAVEDEPLVIALADLLANDRDPDGETPTFVSVQDAVNGTVAESGGTITFTPAPDHSGAASFSYTIRDAAGATSTATVTLDVAAVNDLATLDLDANAAGDHAIAYTENDPATPLVDPSVTILDVDDTQLESATIVLSNGRVGDAIEGTMPAGLALSTVPAVPLAADGRLTLRISGTASLADYEAALAALTYRSSSENPSEDRREVRISVNDGDDESLAARVLIDVTSVNEDPVIGADAAIDVFEDSTATVSPFTLLANDADPDGDTVTFDGVSNAVGGTVGVDAQGMIVFTPDPDYSGPASFDYTVTDGLRTATGTVAVNVLPVNDAPTMDASAAAAGTDHAVAYTENEPGVAVVAADFSLADVDDTELEWISILLADGQTGDILEVGTLPAGITANVVPSGALVAPGSMTVTLTGPASLADFEAAMTGLTFRSVSEQPSEAERHLQMIASDGDAASNLVNVSISVAAVNDAPVANPDGPFTTPEDTPLVLSSVLLTGNDTDADADALTLTAVSGAVGGTVALLNGAVTFTPDADFFGDASFDYSVTDGTETVTATASVTVTPVDDAPAIDLDAARGGTGYAADYTEDDGPLPIVAPTFTISDVDSPELFGARVQLLNGQVGDVIEVGALPAGITAQVVPSDPLVAPGALVVTLSGTADQADYERALAAITYRSASQSPDETPRLIDVAVRDGTDESNVARSRITVTAVNDEPVAAADGPFSTAEDTDLVLSSAELTVNDTDADGDVLLVTDVTNALGGTVALDAAGLVTFTPTADYNGPAGFTYTIDDGQGGTAQAEATIEVTAVDDAPTLDLSASAAGSDYDVLYIENDAPTAIVGSDIRIEDVDSPEIVSATIVLVNGQRGDVLDVSGLPPAITAAVVPAGPLAAPGPVTVTLTGTEIAAVYEFALQAVAFRSASETPDETPRRVEVSVNDGSSSSALAVTTITVMAVNDEPVAAPVALSGVEDTPLTFDPTADATDLDGDPLVVSSIEGTAVAAGSTVTIGAGTVGVGADGRTLTFTPRPNLNGQIAFAFELFDGEATSGSTVSIDIAAVNDVPAPVDDTAALDEDTSTTFDPVANDADGDGDALSITAIAGQAATPGATVRLPEGDITVGLDGRTLTFTPLANYNGTLAVPYEVADGQGARAEATITFEVAAVNDPLTLLGQPPAMTFNDGSTVRIDMAAYVSDPDGDPIAYTATGLPAGLSIDPATGLITGRLDSDASSTSPYTITVTADDRMGSTIPVTFQLTALNVAPVSLGDRTVPMRDGDIVAWNAAVLFEDRDGDALTYTATGLPAWASLDPRTGEITGVVPFDASQTGPVTIELTATDPSGASATSTVTFEPSNPAPVLSRPFTTLYAGEAQEVMRDLNDHVRDGGMDGDTLTWTVTGLPEGVTFDPDTATISGAPAPGTMRAEGYEVTVRVDDGQGGTLEVSFTFFVGDLDALPALDPFDALALPDVASEDVDTETTAAIVSDTVDEVQDLGGIADRLDERPDETSLALGTETGGAVIAAVEGAGSLSAAAEAAASDDVAIAVRGIVADADPLAVSTASAAFALSTARPEPTIEYVLDENGDLVVVVSTPAEEPADEPDEPLVIEAPDLATPHSRTDEDATVREGEEDGDAVPRGGALDVSAHVRPGRVFVDVASTVFGETASDIAFALRDDGPAAGVAMQVARMGFATFGVPADLVGLGLTLAAQLPDGTLVVEDVEIDTATGEVRRVAPTSDRAIPQGVG